MFFMLQVFYVVRPEASRGERTGRARRRRTGLLRSGHAHLAECCPRKERRGSGAISGRSVHVGRGKGRRGQAMRAWTCASVRQTKYSNHAVIKMPFLTGFLTTVSKHPVIRKGQKKKLTCYQQNIIIPKTTLLFSYPLSYGYQ